MELVGHEDAGGALEVLLNGVLEQFLAHVGVNCRQRVVQKIDLGLFHIINIKIKVIYLRKEGGRTLL